MGILNFLSKQFVDVIQWTEGDAGVLAYRYPMADMEIQNGGQLIVRETQTAAFFNEGKFADQFQPGTYSLNTQNLPVLTNLKNWDKFFESPFKSDVYFFSHREQLDQKWGTTQPITIRDKEFGPIRIRAFGNYSYAVTDSKVFWTKLCGTAEKYTVGDAEGQLRTAILTSLGSFFGKSDVAFIDMAANQEAFSAKLKDIITPTLANYGLELKSFNVASLSLPEELEKHLDRVGSIRILGDLQRYTQFQAADSISIAAGNGDGAAGAGVGLGAGLAMGQAMINSMGGGMIGQMAGGAKEDPIQMIEKLGDLLKKGILTQEEFDKKKTELLSKIS
jgi:membrane protease subunit (stomatin/prohibitin family)